MHQIMNNTETKNKVAIKELGNSERMINESTLNEKKMIDR